MNASIRAVLYSLTEVLMAQGASLVLTKNFLSYDALIVLAIVLATMNQHDFEVNP